MFACRTSTNSEHELALLLTGTRASRTVRSGRINELASNLDYSRLETLLRKQGTLALLGQRLRDTVTLELPSHFCKQVDEYTLAARKQGLSQQMLTIRLVAALEEADIRVLPFKGPILGERLFGDIGARVSADIDLLVAESDLSHAVDVVARFGYERHPRTMVLSTAQHSLHECLVHPSGLPQVELHWRVHWYETRFSTDLLARSTPGPDGCLRARPIDELAELLLLYVRDGFVGLRLVADVAAWWDRYGAELDPDGLTAVTREYPALRRSLATAAILAERLAGVPAHELFPAPILSRASRTAIRLANWPPRGNRGQIRANISLVDWALAPAGESRTLVRRHLFVGGEDLLSRWPNSGSGTLSTLSRVWLRTGLRAVHALRVLAHYAIAGWVLLLLRKAWAPLPPSLGRSD